MKYLDSIIMIGITISIALGFIASISIPNSGQFGFMITLFGSIIVLLVDVIVRLEKLGFDVIVKLQKLSQIDLITSYFKVVKEGSRFSEIIFIWGLRTKFDGLSSNSIQVEQIHVLNLWRDCISGSTSWCAIDYSKQAWEKGLENIVAQNIQEERIKSRAVIKRVFLYDSDVERDNIMSIMKSQEHLGVQVRHMKLSELKDKLNPDILSKMKSFSFALVDDSWVYREFYDEKTRKLTHAEVLEDKNFTALTRYVFYQAFENGEILQG